MRKKFAIMIVSLFSAALISCGCDEKSTSLSFPGSELPMVSFQGFKIPQFPTARGQLNYAKSGFPDPEEKKAAFKIMFYIFPEAKVECGNAALYLAYMNFGYDYRFAKRQDYTKAIAAYHDVIKKFKAYPQILVKAYWYLGWIHCDLLHEKETGIQYFWHIAKTWPDITMGISSPVPWVSLVYRLSVKTDHPPKKIRQKKWASLALLEIIRNATHTKEVFHAFDMLWENYRNSVTTGLAIKLMLQNEKFAQKALPHVDKFLALNIANPYLAKEIQDKAREY